MPPLCLPPCRVPPLYARVLGEAHQAGYCSSEARRGWAVHADRGCCELRRFLPQTLWETQLAHAHGYWDSVKTPTTAWNSRAALESSCLDLLLSTLPVPCRKTRAPEPQTDVPQCFPKRPAQVGTQFHISSSRTCHSLGQGADGPFSVSLWTTGHHSV